MMRCDRILKQIYVRLYYQDSLSKSGKLMLDADITVLLDDFVREATLEEVALPENFYQLYHQNFGSLMFLKEIIHQIEFPRSTFNPPKSLEFEWLSAAYLLEVLKEVFVGKISLMQLCQLVQQIEAAIMGSPRNLPDNIDRTQDKYREGFKISGIGWDEVGRSGMRKFQRC